MKNLGIDGRSAEEKLIDEMNEEQQMLQEQNEERFSSMGIPLKPGQREVVLNQGAHPSQPQVSMIIDKNKTK